MLAVPGTFLALFSRDPAVQQLGVPYLRVLAVCFVFTGVEIVTVESLLGSGHTTTLSWIYSIVSLIRMPLAFVVARYGLPGIAWLITLTCIVRTLVILAWAARGTWKRGLARELHGVPPPELEAP